MIWPRKFGAMLLVSLGVALILLPFPEGLGGERPEDVVRLEAQPAPFTEEAARTRFGGSFVKLSYEGLAGRPELRETILGLQGASGSRCVPPAEWSAFLGEAAVAEPVGLVYAFRDGLYRIESVRSEDSASDGPLVCFEVARLGAYDNRDWSPMTRLEARDLQGYPGVRAELERLAAGPVPSGSEGRIPARRWRRFLRREVEPRGGGPSFVVLDRLFRGTVVEKAMPWKLDAPWLRRAAVAAGAAALLLGLVVAAGGYRIASARPGIPVAPTWFVVFCDLVGLAAGVFLVGVALDTVWVGLLGQPSLIGLEPEWPRSQAITGLHFVSVPGLVIVWPLLTLWLASLSAQRIEVDGERITSRGALGFVSIPWDGLERVRLREQKNPFSFSVMDFRGLQKVLDLEGLEETITINEPGSRKLKNAIIDVLRRHAPPEKDGLLEMLEEW